MCQSSENKCVVPASYFYTLLAISRHSFPGPLVYSFSTAITHMYTIVSLAVLSEPQELVHVSYIDTSLSSHLPGTRPPRAGRERAEGTTSDHISQTTAACPAPIACFSLLDLFTELLPYT